MRRDPLYCWDVDPASFAVSNRQVVCDSVRAGIFPDDPALQRSTCFASVLPHTGGKKQLVLHRVMTFRYLPGFLENEPPITPELLDRHGIYQAELEYDAPHPPTWEF